MTGAILLAGGRGSRMDGADKPGIDLGGGTLLQRAREAVSGCFPVVAVGEPTDAVTGVIWTREDPPFTGPAAAVVAALAATDPAGDPEWTYVLACDLPGVAAAVTRLENDVPLFPADTEGVCLGTGSSRPQWLIGAYRTAALRRAAAALPDAGRDAAMRTLLDDLAVAVIAAPDDETADIDTWDDLARARRTEEPAS
ncbi:molybdenum cofactor guanylyltransferase [Microbacterium telephonicum]|uniref:Molybdopterin-guanine dinucleotide biosynthesis protein A n=1 Tax=Microbacterium telephonicum TaxID=1714841 RepID=A0A498CBV6_9MICO|nr:NTP transferase domain-containing protein [Microbacterium telephonicum]RLK52923.1 molybdopterin-guanine dinucleotide biosynthesis protein A [Microbacterium telephonicum]